MRVLYHWPHPSTVYAGRTIAYGYKHAWEDLDHHFSFLTNDDDLEQKLITEKPDIFMTALNSLHLKFLNLKILKKAKHNSTLVFVNIPFWNSPFAKTRITENGSLKNNLEYLSLINSKNYGDLYFNICEQGDPRMEGFKAATGYQHKTLLLAADATQIFYEYDKKFAADISYIGTNLPDKKAFFQDVIFPLRQQHQVKIYGQDWTRIDQISNTIQKAGQYFNIPYFKSHRKPSLDLSDERKVYASSVISINVHEHYQKEFGDLNERTFKIPLAGGFEIVDNVSSLSKYFIEGKEMIVAKNDHDWKEKLSYYLVHPETRASIIKAGQKKILAYHTYHHRVESLLKWYDAITKSYENT